MLERNQVYDPEHERANVNMPKPPDFNGGENEPAMLRDAYHGLAGDVVRAIEPHSEGDPVALLVNYLAFFGNVIGNGPYYLVEGDRHRTNIFAVIVGKTSKGRKGTSSSRIRQIFRQVDELWAANCFHDGGLSSGEGLIWHVRDATTKPNGDGAAQETDPGVPDKRLMIQESEFAQALAVMERQGNTLSRVVRDAWDRGDLATLTKNAPTRATNALITIVGHITEHEFRERLKRTEMFNGFANRFLIFLVHRSKLLPDGGNLHPEVLRALAQRTGYAVQHARATERVTMTEQAKLDWARVYPVLSAERPGLLGAVLGRGEAQVIRLAMLYALLDLKREIDVQHLRAGLAVWEHSEASARRVFGDMLGNSLAEKLLDEIVSAGSAGLTRTQIRDACGRHYAKRRIDEALELLRSLGRVQTVQRETGGRPAETWTATDAAE